MEPSKLLDKLTSVVENNTDKEKGGSKGLVASIIIFFVVLIGVFVFAWVSNKNSRELAKLRHEKHKREVENGNLAVEKEATINDKERGEIQADIDETQKDIADIDSEIESVKKAHEENLKNISSITSWEDI